jgi:hypothetical protein
MSIVKGTACVKGRDERPTAAPLTPAISLEVWMRHTGKNAAGSVSLSTPLRSGPLFFLRPFADSQDHHCRAIDLHPPDERRLEDAAVWSGKPPPLSSIHLLSAFLFRFRNSAIRVHAILRSRHTPPGGGIVRIVAFLKSHAPERFAN